MNWTSPCSLIFFSASEAWNLRQTDDLPNCILMRCLAPLCSSRLSWIDFNYMQACIYIYISIGLCMREDGSIGWSVLEKCMLLGKGKRGQYQLLIVGFPWKIADTGRYIYADIWRIYALYCLWMFGKRYYYASRRKIKSLSLCIPIHYS